MGWKITILSVYLVLHLTLSSTADDSVADLKKYSQELTTDVLNVKNLQKAVPVCEKILVLQPNDLETMALFCRLYWSLGHHEAEKRAQKQWFVRGRNIAEQIKKIHPKKADGYYWYGVNYGEWIERSSLFAKIGAKKIILENMEKVLTLDKKYDSGGAYTVIARINYISPGGSYSKAIEYYQCAIAIEPQRSTPYLYLGELYLHEHIFDKAEQLLKKVVSMDINPRFAIEARNDRKSAEWLLKKLDKKEDRFPEQEQITGR